MSATDLVAFLECGHLTALDHAAVRGGPTAPAVVDDPAVEVLRRRGMEHEHAHLARLDAEASVACIADIAEGDRVEALRAREADTVAAMREGMPYIYQATFFDETAVPAWRGHADFLYRVDTPSGLGAHAYEPVDTKLARRVKPSAVLQLCEYAGQVERVQGVAPEHVHVVLGDRSQVTLRVAEVAAYHRAARARFLDALSADTETYPVPVGHCPLCRWDETCRARREADDHLSRVANLSREQVRKLVGAGVATMAVLAGGDDAPVPRIGAATLARLRQQARLQVAAVDGRPPPFELVRPVEADRGLCLLPEPDEGDLFYDIEGDPFVGDGGLEYLHGVGWEGADGFEFRSFWSHAPDQERRAFEAVVDFIVARRQRYPNMHVYHYAPYETTALGRLMGRYGTREEEIDDLLRGHVFVDLYRVVRQGVVVGTSSYSIKKLEPLYREARTGAVTDAGSSIVEYERWLEVGDDDILRDIEAYNRDDVESTWQLRRWLEERHAEAATSGEVVPRPTVKAEQPDQPGDEGTDELVDRLRAAAVDPAVYELMADLLRWHRREDKPAWWRYFQLVLYSDEAELLADTECIAGLRPVGEPEVDKASLIQAYDFDPAQEFKVRRGATVCDPAVERAKYYDRTAKLPPPLTVVDIDAVRGTIRLRRGKKWVDCHPTAVMPHDIRQTKEQRASLRRVAETLLAYGLDGPGPALAARRLLARQPPQVFGHDEASGPLREAGESTVGAAVRIVTALDHSYLPIQGPPGSGKTTTAAAVIVSLVARGRQVGITANSHAVIGNLLDCVMAEATRQGVPVRAIQKVSKGEQACGHPDVIQADNQEIEAALAAGTVNVVAGTAWLFSREGMTAALDTLVVDEAGQLSLANVLAVAPAARNLMLVGDPQQLAQPSKGVHPDGAGVSALDHVLAGSATVADDLGLFLDRTWRLHPQVCAFVSEQVYDGRLFPAPGNERQAVADGPVVGGAGLRWVPVDHEGNRTSSEEEAVAVRALFEALLGREWTDRHGPIGVLGVEDILVVAPYNAQVSLLGEHLPAGARIGTVDRFQGQEAPVVLVSLAASDAEQVPRGMEFLYSRHRLNVAVSRAQALAVMVASPALLAVRCRSIAQMRLANMLCRFVELATPATAHHPT